MKEVDLLVIGAGSGLDVAAAAAESGLRVAIVEKGPLGGTCLNRGCIPSKMLIYCADVARTLDRSKEFGLVHKGYQVKWKSIIERVSKSVDEDAANILKSVKRASNISLLQGEGKFVGERTIQVGKQKVRAKKVVIAAGARPAIPPIPGLDKVSFMTSKEALRLKKQPKSLTIIGGGYIGCELAHFYGSLGTKVTIIQRNDVLVPAEDPTMSEVLTMEYNKRFKVLTNHTATAVEKNGSSITVTAKDNNSGRKKRITSDALLVATGVRPNADRLDLDKTGVKLRDDGFIAVNDFLETSAKNVWAFGDIIGRYMFKHMANHEAQYVYGAIRGHRHKVDYSVAPHAVFSHPQIAAVGATESDSPDAAVGTYSFSHTGMGEAMRVRKEYVVKVLADRSSRRIIGCHIIGPEASTLIHESILAMKLNATADDVVETIHVHPALPEVVQRACANIKW
ncbi:SidA/IucD/PvdA family monooxygenase [Candidatus Woesearchaeota archaeon]|nr:SidA/IucD/PvdA family monooxygenase [Candidatus Woesearchaeota archaeon]